MPTPSLSIVLALYNGQTYLLEQLDSLAAQSRPFDELVLRDDGSTDHTISIVDQWIQKHPHLPIIRLTKPAGNLGFTANFRTLLENAKGDYILLCDQDDRWNPDKLQVLADAAAKYPQASVIVSSFTFMDQNGKPFSIVARKGWSNQNLIGFPLAHPAGMNQVKLEDILDHNIGQGCTMLVRKDIIQKYLELDLPLPHDWALALLGAMDGGLYYLDQPLMEYRIHSENTTGLPQAKETSKLAILQAKIRKVVRPPYRTVSAPFQDKLDVLKALKLTGYKGWSQQDEVKIAFFETYLQVINEKSWKKARKLWAMHLPSLLTYKEWILMYSYLLFGKTDHS